MALGESASASTAKLRLDVFGRRSRRAGAKISWRSDDKWNNIKWKNNIKTGEEDSIPIASFWLCVVERFI